MTATPRQSPQDPPWKLVVVFTLAGLLSGTALAGVHVASAPRIARNEAEAVRRAVLATVPGATTFGPVSLPAHADGSLPGRAYAARDGRGVLRGYAVQAEGPGFMDTIRLLYGLDARAERVVGLQILASRETPGLGDKIATDPAFVGSFGRLAVQPSIVAVTRGAPTTDNGVDCIAGATVSSRAVVNIVDSSVHRWLPVLGSLPETEP